SISAIANRQQRLNQPLGLLIGESSERATNVPSENSSSPTISELITMVYERFEHMPPNNLQNLWDEVRTSSLPTAITDFRVWLQQFLQHRSRPNQFTLILLCLEFHLGVNNMNYDLSDFSS